MMLLAAVDSGLSTVIGAVLAFVLGIVTLIVQWRTHKTTGEAKETAKESVTAAAESKEMIQFLKDMVERGNSQLLVKETENVALKQQVSDLQDRLESRAARRRRTQGQVSNE
jgi:uncharacterized protein Yka (UPF0111/DUF47 family)